MQQLQHRSYWVFGPNYIQGSFLMSFKKLLSVILSIILCFSLILMLSACGDNEPQGTNHGNSNVTSEQTGNESNKNDEDGKVSSTLQTDQFWYETYEWNKVEKKTNVDFKMFGFMENPFNPSSFDGHLHKLSTHGIYEKDKYSELKCETLSDLLSDNRYTEPTFSTTSSNSIWFYIDENTSCKMNITSNCADGEIRASVKDAIDNKDYFFYSTYDVQEMLDVKAEVTDSKDDTPVLEKLVEKFGKPEFKEALSMNTGDEAFALNQLYYELRWIYEDYTISVFVQEMCGAYSSGNTYHEVDVSTPMVFTNVSWQKYLAHEAENN